MKDRYELEGFEDEKLREDVEQLKLQNKTLNNNIKENTKDVFNVKEDFEKYKKYTNLSHERKVREIENKYKEIDLNHTEFKENLTNDLNNYKTGIDKTISDNKKDYDNKLTSYKNELNQNVNEFKQNINDLNSELTNEFNIIKDKVENKIGDIEVGFFDNVVYPNAHDRLNSEFSKIKTELDKAELLNYEGGIMKCDNTYSGMTNDILIKGRTLQNLFNVESFNSGASTTLTKEGDWYTWSFINEGSATATFNIKNNLFKNSTKYKCITFVKSNSLSTNFRVGTAPTYIFGDGKSIFARPTETGTLIYENTTNENISENKIAFYVPKGVVGESITFKIVILEITQELNNVDLSQLNYFEGIKSTGETEKIGDKYKIGAKSLTNNFIDIKDFNTTGGDTIYFNLHNNVSKNKKYFLNVKFKKIFTHLSFYLVETPSQKEFHSVGDLSQHIKKIYQPRGDINNYNQIMFYSTDGLSINDFEFLQFTESEKEMEYVNYNVNERYLLLDEPPKSLPNGSADTINHLGVETRKIGYVVIDGINTKFFNCYTSNKVNVYECSIRLNNCKPSSFGLCNKFKNIVNYTLDEEHFYTYSSGDMVFFINRDKIDKQSGVNLIDKLNNLCKAEPIIIYYELAEPIIIDHKKNLNLKTYEGVTHILSTNTLKPSISCKVPSNVNMIISEQHEKIKQMNILNNELIEENKELILGHEVQAVQILDTETAINFILMENLNIQKLKVGGNNNMESYFAKQIYKGALDYEQVVTKYPQYKEGVDKLLKEYTENDGIIYR